MSPLIPDVVPHDVFTPDPEDRKRWNAWYAEAFKATGARFLPLLPDHDKQFREWVTERGRVIKEAEQAEEAKRRALAWKPPYVRNNQPDATYTYLVGIEGSTHVKIGFAKEPEKRVAYLQTGSPMTLSLLWAEEGVYEALLHAKFAPYRVRGEWFDFTELGDPVEVVTAAVERIKADQEQ